MKNDAGNVRTRNTSKTADQMYRTVRSIDNDYEEAAPPSTASRAQAIIRGLNR